MKISWHSSVKYSNYKNINRAFKLKYNMFKVWSAQSSGKSRRLRDGCKLRLFARIRIFGTSTPQFHTSVPYKDHTFSAPKIPQFNTKIPQFHTENPSVPHILQFHTPLCWPEGFLWDWVGGGTEEFWCLTEGFWELKRCGPCVEAMCWNKGVCVELRGTRL